MTMLTDEDIGSGTLRFAKDYIGIDYHNDSHTHIDALSHVAFDGALYNGRRAESVTAEGAQVETIEVLKDGLVGKGCPARHPSDPRRGAGSSRASTSFRTSGRSRASSGGLGG